ncbi:hypothetical protein [Dactylosporangium sp. CA-233914]|uniref:hypothetical protein n=1 Tax=Dactylosporangium sp. CA-233914 TaxID=3239934 RepID=UPI003D8AF8FD
MGFDASQFVVGDEWAYRLRDTAPSERVRIRAVTPKKTTASIEVEFPDDGHRVQTVPSSRLKTRWVDVEAYDTQQAAWQRIADFELDSVEQSAVGTVYSALIPEEVAELDWRPVENAMIIKDRGAGRHPSGVCRGDSGEGRVVRHRRRHGRFAGRHGPDRGGRLPRALAHHPRTRDR